MGRPDRGERFYLARPRSEAAFRPRPQFRSDALEIPTPTKDRLGLDSDRSWVVLTEANDFIWPGPDLRPLSGRDPSSDLTHWKFQRRQKTVSVLTAIDHGSS